ncbi:MAG: hypothetical protein D6775_06570 [Caldilineae bacterium]|nr:MAG: hypothetical protein D6775_06570 [Caldilineae bacterium]
MPHFNVLAAVLSSIPVAALAVVWWVRRIRRGVDWVFAAVPLAFGASYLSSFVFRVSAYQAGCQGFCPGWWGYPLPTHIGVGVGRPEFTPGLFVANSLVYYAVILVASALVLRLAQRWGWSEKGFFARLGFVAVVILLPLAISPMLFPPPQPEVSGPSLRLAINAAQSWRWQLRARGFMDRRLALVDVRQHPDGERHRVCFLVYTWFYLPYRQVYVDLEPVGVRATGGGVIPRSASCWVQP